MLAPPVGFWLVLGAKKVFMSYRAFPWFREFTARELAGVRRPAAYHLRWPEFDIDLDLESIEHPERYPLVEKRSAAIRFVFSSGFAPK